MNLRNLLVVALCTLPLTVFGTKATTTTGGDLGTNGNWSTNPTTVDTLIVNRTMTWGTLNWSGSSFSVIIIANGGSISPTGNNSVFTIPSGALIVIETGGQITNTSGNSSNHSITIGTVDVWGKRSCLSNATIPGPALVNAANPCGFVILPVVLVEYKVVSTATSNMINWVSSSESGLNAYCIDRSYDGKSYERIATVEPTTVVTESGLKRYRYNDKGFNVNTTHVYYRLSEWRNSGEISQLALKKASSVYATSTAVLQDNGILTVMGDQTIGALQLFDMQGKLVAKSENSNTLDASRLQKGHVYLLSSSVVGNAPIITKIVLL
jgi:hypothetical protein